MGPETLLDIHERLRRDGRAVASILVGRSVGEARAFWCAWLRAQGRSIVVSPGPKGAVGIAAYRAIFKTVETAGLLFAGPVEDVLPAAIEAACDLPRVSVATAIATDALAVQLASVETSAELIGHALQGLVPLSREDGRIVDVVAARPAAGPLLRSAFEGVLYYLLEARPETKGLFRTNFRLRHVEGARADEVDLVAEQQKIAIEIDGGQHKTWDHTRRDEGKDARLRSLGYEVLRFEARDVATRPTEVWQRVYQSLGQRNTP